MRIVLQRQKEKTPQFRIKFSARTTAQSHITIFIMNQKDIAYIQLIHLLLVVVQN